MKRLTHCALLLYLCWCATLCQAAELPAMEEIQRQAKHYYDTQGEWAGTFVIQRFLRHRLADVSENHFVAHLEYEWAFKQDATRTGTDERTFEFSYHDQKWHLIKMGGNHSGSF